MRKILILVFLIGWLFTYSCNSSNSAKPLPGEIVVSNWPEKNRKYFMYNNSDEYSTTFELGNNGEFEYSSLTWMNTKDAFVGVEIVRGLTPMHTRVNIVQFDLTGQITGRLYEAEKGELAAPTNLSWDDKYLLFTTEHRIEFNKDLNEEGYARSYTLSVMETEQRKVVLILDSVTFNTILETKESPWLHKRYQFVYSISSDEQLKLRGKKDVSNPVQSPAGIYVFDILKRESTMLVPDGRNAIASPANNQIAYEKDNSLRVLDLNTNQEKIIYEHSPKEILRGTHWTPDGKAIYFAYSNNWGISDILKDNGEKLIEVSTGKEKSFNKIGHGFRPYTWK